MSEYNAPEGGGAIDNLVVVHGWTLSPDKPGWYGDLATFIEARHAIDVAVPAIPTEESPEDCSEALRGLITPRTLVVGHSLGVMVALNHMATEFPEET